MKEVRELKLKLSLLVYLNFRYSVLLIIRTIGELSLKATILLVKNMPKLILGVLNG